MRNFSKFLQEQRELDIFKKIYEGIDIEELKRLGIDVDGYYKLNKTAKWDDYLRLQRMWAAKKAMEQGQTVFQISGLLSKDFLRQYWLMQTHKVNDEGITTYPLRAGIYLFLRDENNELPKEAQELKNSLDPNLVML